METLLGHLAQFSSFAKQGELLCTQGLTYLVQEHAAARAAIWETFLRPVGVGEDAELRWQAEAPQDDGGRPDLEARDADDAPVVKIEAKLGAALSEAQLQSYADALLDGGAACRVLLLLVPEHRSAEARKLVQSVFGRSPAGAPQLASEVHVSVVTWHQLFEALATPASGRLGAELTQLRGMYDVLNGDFIAPLASADEVRDWRSRASDFESLVEKATRLLSRGYHPVSPMGTESVPAASPGCAPGRYRRRYVARPLGTSNTFFSIGVRDPFEPHDEQLEITPIWMRFHRRTPAFVLVRQRLEASRQISERLVTSGGHLWLPLDAPLKVAGTQMVRALVKQAEEVIAVAYDLDAPRTAPEHASE